MITGNIPREALRRTQGLARSPWQSQLLCKSKMLHQKHLVFDALGETRSSARIVFESALGAI